MISVIIPVYNVEDYLNVCINSVLSQTFQDFEIICIDDASTDSSLEILKYFSQKDSRIKILKNDVNLGPGYSRNRGLDEAKGKYISFLDGDDWISPNAFEILFTKAENDNLDVLMFKNIVYYESSGEFKFEKYYDMEFMNKYENTIFNHFDLDKTKLFAMANAPWNKFYLKSFLDEYNIRFPNENIIYEDNPFFYKLITLAGRISIINKYLHNRRRRPNSIMTLNNERIFDTIDICYLILHVFLDNVQLYHYYKKQVLKHIFMILLNGKYDQIEEKFRKNYFKQAQSVYRNFIKYYDLKDDILEIVDNDILDKFKVNEIIENINNLPKLSIVVPVFNTCNKLPNFFNALLKQTIDISELEVIFVDNCSTDGSDKLLDDYVSKYENMKVIHLTKNSGFSSKAKNVGIINTTSDYFIIQDSTDVLAPDACELLYNAMIEEDVDLVGGMARIDGGDGYKVECRPWTTILNRDNKIKKIGVEKLLSSNELFKYKIDAFNENPLVIMDHRLNAKIFKKSFFLKNNFKFCEDLTGYEDSVVLFKCFIKAKGLCFINKVIYDHKILSESPWIINHPLKTIKSRIISYKIMYDLSCSNNIKDLFVKKVLGDKINYWINSHLLKSEVPTTDLISIFKSYQILFSECVDYDVEISDFSIGVSKYIKNNNFEEAAKSISQKRKSIS